MRVVIRLIFSVIFVVSMATKSPILAAALAVVLLGGFIYMRPKARRRVSAPLATPSHPLVLPGADPRLTSRRN